MLAANAFAIDVSSLVTNQPNVYDVWQRTVYEFKPSYTNLKKVYRGQCVSVYNFYSKYSLSTAKKAEISFDITIKDPSGKVILNKKGNKGYNNKIRERGDILITETPVILCFSRTDAIGEYKIIMTHKDLVSNLDIKKEVSLRLEDYKYEKLIDSKKEYNVWHDTYYVTPQPEKALSAYEYFAKSTFQLSKTELLENLFFYKSVFDNNPYIYDEIKKRFAISIPKIREYYAMIMAVSDQNTKVFEMSLKPEEEKLFNELKKNGLPPIYEKITTPATVMPTWNLFLATGNYYYIKLLAFALDATADGNNEKNKTIELMADNIFRNNIRVHRHMYSFSKHILQNEKITPKMKTKLLKYISLIK